MNNNNRVGQVSQQTGQQQSPILRNIISLFNKQQAGGININTNQNNNSILRNSNLNNRNLMSSLLASQTSGNISTITNDTNNESSQSNSILGDITMQNSNSGS